MQLFLLLLLTLAPAVPEPKLDAPGAITVDCARTGELERVLRRVERLDSAELLLEGLCEGPQTVSAGNVTLRAASPGSGLTAGAATLPPETPILDVQDARVALRDLVVRGGGVGVHVRGAGAEVLIVGSELREQTEIALWVEDGATGRLIEAELVDGGIGIYAGRGANLNVQRSRVSGFDVGVIVSDRSFGALSESVVEDSRTGGMNVTNRSDVNVLGGAFLNNTQVHLNANDWSSIKLLNGVQLGEDGDPTTFAIGATRHSRVTAGSSFKIHGSISILDGASARVAEAVIAGNVFSQHFADIFMRNVYVEGVVACYTGADILCARSDTAGGVMGCSPSSCGPPVSAGATDVVPDAHAVPEFRPLAPQRSPRRID